MPGTRARSSIDGLREKERVAVDLLARGKTCREVARALEISERCLYTWRKRPAVQRAIFDLQREFADESGAQGLTVMPAAILTLTEIMNDPNARAADRISASRALLNGAAAYQERKVLERTVSDLESQLFGLVDSVKAKAAEITEDELLELMPSADPEAE